MRLTAASRSAPFATARNNFALAAAACWPVGWPWVKAEQSIAVCRYLVVSAGPARGRPSAFLGGVLLQADIPDVCGHHLPHTFASLLLSGGVSLEMIGRLLGHTRIGTTKRFAHLIASPLRAKVNAAGEMMSSGCGCLGVTRDCATLIRWLGSQKAGSGQTLQFALLRVIGGKVLNRHSRTISRFSIWFGKRRSRVIA